MKVYMSTGMNIVVTENLVLQIPYDKVHQYEDLFSTGEWFDFNAGICVDIKIPKDLIADLIERELEKV